MLGFWSVAEYALAELGAGQGFTPQTTTIYCSDRGFISKSTDSLVSTAFPGRARQALRVSRSAIGARLAGITSGRVGDIEIDNLDGLFDIEAAGYAVDGRTIVVRAVAPGGSYDDAELAFQGSAKGWHFNGETIRVQLADGAVKLDTPIQSVFYAGSGGKEGGDDIKGQPKPLCFGKAWNVEPVYLGVISGDDTYQVHNGQINDVPACRDRVNALTKAASPPSAGEYSVDTSDGTIRLGSTPVGPVTADVEGAAPSGTFKQTTSTILRHVLDTHTSITDIEIDSAALATLDTDAPAVVGLYVPAQRTVRDVVGELIQGVGGYAGFDRTGRFTAGVFTTPAGAIRAVLDETNIVRAANRYLIERVPLPVAIEPAAWRVRVGFKRNETVQAEAASGAAEADRKFAAERYREAVASDSDVSNRHLLATEVFVPALYATSADASTEATRLLALYAPGRALYRVTAVRMSPEIDIGTTVRVQLARFGLDNGKLGRVASIEIDAARGETVLEVFV